MEATAALTLEQFMPLARSLAHKLATQPADQDDLVQEGCLALHRALSSGPVPANPYAFAKTVLFRQMLNHRRRSKDREQAHLPLPAESDDGVVMPDQLLGNEVAQNDDAEYLETYLRDLEAVCGKSARWAAENLLRPGSTVGKFAVMDADKRTSEALPEQRCRGVEHVKITHVQIREALGLPVSQWRPLLSSIRSFTSDWLARHRED